MRKIVTGLLAAAALTAIASGPARADDVTLLDGGGFYTFFFGSPGFGPEFQTLAGDDLTFDFTLTSASVLYVADGYFDGDQFSVTVNDLTTSTSTDYTTSTPQFTGAYIDNDYNQAFLAGSTFSHIAINVGPGSYKVTGSALVSPFGSGAAGIQLGGVVPEPAVWTMMMVGFGGLGAMLRRARRTAAALA